MPGPFDWNGNGSSDAFDHFMDMTVMDEVNSGDDESSDYDDYDSDASDEDYALPSSYSGSRYPSSSNTAERAKSGMSFQDELRKNMRTPEAVRKENAEKLNNAMQYDAERTFREIKSALMYKAKNAEYITENGVTYLTCFCPMPHRFMKTRREDNGDQLRQNQQTFALFRDPNLVYMTWNNYEIEPKYWDEYWQYLSALTQLASKENIKIESVVYSGKEKKYVDFPSRVRNDYSFGWTLCVKATTVISGNSAHIPPKSSPQATYVDPTAASQNKPQNNQQQGQTDSNGTTILKSFLAIGLCIGAFALCMSGEMGELGMGLLLIGAAFGGYFILKK